MRSASLATKDQRRSAKCIAKKVPWLHQCAGAQLDLAREVCGDGQRVFEFCDDGNTKSGDGCSAACEIEDGYRCLATPGGADESRLLFRSGCLVDF